MQFGRIYYEHAGRGEPGYVCLRALRTGAEDLRRPLGEVRIEGAVVGVYRVGESCPAAKT
ncbi:MAG TPA: hypothetical protein VGX48_17845 [Pyrinomonadaceae bacterium]|nr:hypothetical protein [Pyrinomonadaceae bacterium]